MGVVEEITIKPIIDVETTTLKSKTSTTTSSTIPTNIDSDENFLDEPIDDDISEEDQEEEEEILEVEDPDSTDDESVHTLQCLPEGQIPSGEMIMSCKEQQDRQPITVIISSEGLDLDTLSRKNVKIVVKDYMLMEMQQRP